MSATAIQVAALFAFSGVFVEWYMTTTAAPAGTPVEPAASATPAQAAQPASPPPDQPFSVEGGAAAPETTPATPAGNAGAPVAAAPETPPASETPPPKGFDDLSDDEKAEHPWVKDRVAREVERVRRTTERETTARDAQMRREYAASEAFVRDFETEIESTAQNLDPVTGRPQINRDKVDGMFRTLLSTGAETTIGAIGAFIRDEVGADFKPTTEEQELLAAAKQQYDADPLRGGPQLVRQWLRMRDRAVLDERSNARFEEGRRQGAREAEARASEAAAREAREAAQRNPGPTPTDGTPAPPAWTSQRQIDKAVAAYARGERGPNTLDADAYRQLQVSGTYFNLPR